MTTYKKICDLVLSNATVMRGTSIQLVEINSHTPQQWYEVFLWICTYFVYDEYMIRISLSICDVLYYRYNRRSKGQEKEVLEQGITLPTPPIPSSDDLPPAQKELCLTQPQTQPHVFVLPTNTAGEANTRVPILPKTDSHLNDQAASPAIVLPPST